MKDRVGRFELANGRMLFLDEVSEICQELQSKLPRALQEGEFERIGDTRTRKIDVKVINIIAALERTNGKIYGCNGAAAPLGIRPTTLTARPKILGLKNSHG